MTFVKEGSNALENLPVEVLDLILAYLPGDSLALVAGVSRGLLSRARNERLWEALVRGFVGSVTRSRSGHKNWPLPRAAGGWRHLYAHHHPFWYLLKQEVFFSDEVPDPPGSPLSRDACAGKLVVARFDTREGSIMLQRMVASYTDNGEARLHRTTHPSIMIPNMDLSPEFRIRLKQRPFATLSMIWEKDDRTYPLKGANPERDMINGKCWSPLIPRRDKFPFYSIAMCEMESVEPRATNIDWPPAPLCTNHMISNTLGFIRTTWANDLINFFGDDKRSVCSDRAFRLCEWQPDGPDEWFGGDSDDDDDDDDNDDDEFGEYGMLNTWFSPLRELWTSTQDKPFQGLYVGDYASHGCEFLLVSQHERGYRRFRDFEDVHATEDGLPKGKKSNIDRKYMADETTEPRYNLPKSQRQGKASSHPVRPVDRAGPRTGSIEAIKMTGDLNVPRGEISWYVDDISDDAATFYDDHGTGSRRIKSIPGYGHVASTGFRNDRFVPIALTFARRDTMIVYWKVFVHSLLTQCILSGSQAATAFRLIL